MTKDWRVSGAVATTLVLWASAFVGIRVALPDLGAGGLSFGRLVVASLSLALLAALLKVRLPARADLLRIAGCGLSGMSAYQLLLNAGERSVPAGTASLLVNAGPIFSVLLALWVLHEPLTARKWAGTAVGFAGAGVMTLAQGEAFRPSADALLILAAALSLAIFFVLQKPLLARYRGFEVTCYAAWSGTLLALPLAPSLVRALPAAGTGPLLALLFLGVGPSALAYITWAYASARLPVASVASTLYLVPFLTIAIGWLVLGETVQPAALGGGALALIGVAITRSTERPAGVERAGALRSTRP